ncbi:TPA: hypothetical protein ACUT68_001066 [Pseudomonas aeruginosa]
MSIDWSKAPEGANKAGFTGPDNYLQFYRIPGRFGDYDYWSEKRGWCGNNFPTCADHLFERPAKVEWDGKGLPPVGTVCRLSGPTRTLVPLHPEWAGCEVKIYAHFESDRGIKMAAYVSDDHMIGGCGVEDLFVRMPTPEQIAAEAREAAIVAMLDLDPPHENGLGLTSRRQFCETLYDAGYRRQEEGK